MRQSLFTSRLFGNYAKERMQMNSVMENLLPRVSYKFSRQFSQDTSNVNRIALEDDFVNL